MKYECFHLVLMVTHACTLRCDYCYVGRKMPRSMELRVGHAAIDRAIHSIRPGGILELGFFGGEPLLEARLVDVLTDYARAAADRAGIDLRTNLTTNGTVKTEAAWEVMLRGDLDLSVSHDGLPEAHDRHRRRPDGRGSALDVAETIERLLDAGRPVRAVMVVRPDTAALLPDGIQWLRGRGRGVRRMDLTLDVWASWTPDDMAPLERAIGAAAESWVAGLPDASINWFDEKAAQLAGLRLAPSGRCGFGNGEIAVAPSGRLYPCERLIGEDAEEHPMRLPGRATDGGDFCRSPAPGRSSPACSDCAIQTQCNTTCRCNNYVRTGDPTRPDALLCLFRAGVLPRNRTHARPVRRVGSFVVMRRETMENEHPVPRPDEPLAASMPDPSGPPQPVVEAGEAMSKTITGLGIGAIVLGGLFWAATASTTCTAGATRSARLEWQSRQAQIEQAIQLDCAETSDLHEAGP